MITYSKNAVYVYIIAYKFYHTFQNNILLHNGRQSIVLHYAILYNIILYFIDNIIIITLYSLLKC